MMDLLTPALAAVREAERRLVAGEISRPQFDAIAGSNVAVIAEAAERYLWLREVGDGPTAISFNGGDFTPRRGERLDAAIDAAMKGGKANG